MATTLTPDAFVWCIAGPHIGESLTEIVERKQRDIERFGWCLWAYGGSGNAHPELQVRRLAAEHGGGRPLPLLMPDTGKLSPEGQPFGGYRLAPGHPVEPIPARMSPVTGGQRSWAFWIRSVAWSADTVINVADYTAPYANAGPTALPLYLRGAHGRACAARSDDGSSASEDIRRVHVVAELAAPWAVYLA